MDNRKKQDSLSYGEFSRLLPRANPNPTQDSPGDSGEDELRETLLGMDYGEESMEDLRDPLEEEDDEEADALHPEKIGESIDPDLLDDNSRVIASNRPDPKDEQKIA